MKDAMCKNGSVVGKGVRWAALCLIAAALLLTACNGNGSSSDSEGETYGGSSSSFLSGSSSGGISFEDIMSFSNSGDTNALVTLFTGASDASSSAEVGPSTVALPAADIGLPTGGSVTLTISGDGVNYSEEAAASPDGYVYFQIPPIAVDSTITVGITVLGADGGTVCAGSSTQTVTGKARDITVPITATRLIKPVITVSSSNGSHKNAAGTELTDLYFWYAKNPATPGTTNLTCTTSTPQPEGTSYTWTVNGTDFAGSAELSKTLADIGTFTSYPATFDVSCTVSKSGVASQTSDAITVTIDRRLPSFYVDITGYPGAYRTLSGVKKRYDVNNGDRFVVQLVTTSTPSTTGESVEFPPSSALSFSWKANGNPLTPEASGSITETKFLVDNLLPNYGKDVSGLNDWDGASEPASGTGLEIKIVCTISYDGMTQDCYTAWADYGRCYLWR